jgi:general secretion pathway protein M
MTPAIREKWTSLSLRERRLVQIATAVVGLGLLYGVGIDPALRGITKLNAELPTLRTESATVKALTDEARRLITLNKAAAPASSNNLRADTEKSLRRVGLLEVSKITSSESSGNSALQVNFASAPFGAVMEWVNLAPRELSVRVQRAKFDRVGGAGKVNGEVVFDGSGSPNSAVTNAVTNAGNSPK